MSAKSTRAISEDGAAAGGAVHSVSRAFPSQRRQSVPVPYVVSFQTASVTVVLCRELEYNVCGLVEGVLVSVILCG